MSFANFANILTFRYVRGKHVLFWQTNILSNTYNRLEILLNINQEFSFFLAESSFRENK